MTTVGTASAVEARPWTILVVEDEVLVRMAVAEDLRDDGFAVIEAADADEALRVLDSSAPCDLVVTDVHMPGSMDGLALTSRIRRTWPQLRVIVISSRPPEPGTAADADAFLMKPDIFGPVAFTARRLLGLAGEDGVRSENRGGRP